MKKLALVLAVLLLAVPALATVNITLTEGTTVGHTKEVLVGYSTSGADANLVRAFGLYLQVNAAAGGDPNVTGVVGNSDYYVHPSNIQITGNVIVDEGSPLVDAGSRNKFYVEMGSLYAADDPEHTTPPASSGTLLTFVVDANCDVSVALDATRGGVVMEDVTDNPTVNLPANLQIRFVSGPPVPTCWTWARQCHGDIDNNATVNITDFYVFADAFNTVKGDAKYYECADLDHNGNVNITDFYAFAANFNTTPPADCP